VVAAPTAEQMEGESEAEGEVPASVPLPGDEASSDSAE
jgi:hypothetical protein